MAPLPAWIESHDPRFDQLVLFNAELELLADGFRWVEGPVWFGDHNCLLFSDIPNNRIMRLGEGEMKGFFDSSRARF